MNANAQLQTIGQLNLDQIKARLMHTETGEGWSLAQANAVEVEYRRFLCLMKLFPNEQVAPLTEVDIFWHYHILDTMQYAADCQHVFGYFLHHLPDSGLRDEDAAAEHLLAGDRMQTLYQATFGEACRPGHVDAAQCAWCVPATEGAQSSAQAGAMSAWCVPGAGRAPAQPAPSLKACCVPAKAGPAHPQALAAATAWCVPSSRPQPRAQAAPASTAWCVPNRVTPNNTRYAGQGLAMSA